jgi:hypothetical protein
VCPLADDHSPLPLPRQEGSAAGGGRSSDSSDGSSVQPERAGVSDGPSTRLRCSPPPEQDAVAGPGIAIQLLERLDQTHAQRIEVNTTHQREQVRLLFEQNGFETVLEQMPHAIVTAVEAHSVAGEQAA